MIRHYLLGFCLLVTAHAAAADDVLLSDPSGMPVGAQAAMARYFDALQVGDVQTLSGLMDGRIKARHDHSMGNPTYAGHLMDTYGGLEFLILGYNDSRGVLLVDYEVGADGDTVRKRVHLTNSFSGYKVSHEQLVP